jgi:hypothetical protein
MLNSLDLDGYLARNIQKIKRHSSREGEFLKNNIVFPMRANEILDPFLELA